MAEEHAIVLSPKQAAQKLGVSVCTIRRLIATRQIECVKVGRQWRVFPGSLARYRVTREERA